MIVAGALLRSAAALSCFTVSLAGQDSTFVLTTTDPTYRAPAFIGNGAFSLVSVPLGITQAPSFAAGVYDHAPRDVPRIAELPAWNAIDVFDGAQWLSQATLDTATVRDYRQTLDMSAGTLRTSYEWVYGARRISVTAEAFVSRADPRLAAVKLVLVPHDSGTLRLSFPLTPRAPPARLALAQLDHTAPDWTLAKVWYPGHVAIERRGGAPNGAVWLEGRTVGRGTPVALAARIGWPAGQKALASHSRVADSGVALDVTLAASPGVPVTVYKYVGVSRSRAGALVTTRAAVARGYDGVLADNRAAWQRLWRTDIRVEGDPELQRVIHAMVFYLLASIREGTSESIPPMGLSTAGYYGHVFWDADTWMFPALVALHPELARSMVMFRYRALAAARRNARKNGYRGAQYPWESDELGEETTPRFAWQNALYENHVTGDVALAQWQYYLATGDSTWLARYGEPVLRATADFWVSRATFDRVKQRYEIHHVVSVDEGLIGVGNDTYTNAIARNNLELAGLASGRVGRTPDARWSRIARGLYIPYDSAAQYHPTYEGAPPEKRGSVVPLLDYPLAVPMSEAAKRNDIESAVRLMIKEGGGAMMTETLYPVIAAELGERALVDTLFPLSYESHVRPPFDALSETPRNDAVNFLTGAGGFLQQVVFGYTGLRLTSHGLQPLFRPVLPSRIRRLVLTHVPVRGRWFDIVVEGDSVHWESPWTFGPFDKPRGANPVITPRRSSLFRSPTNDSTVRWEEHATFNPAAVVRGGKVYLLYRAEDVSGDAQIGHHTSRLGLAESVDGLHFTRRATRVLYPDSDAQMKYEWPGGVEDPRLVETEDGSYVLTYTQWNRDIPRLAVATSRDLIHWTKHGPALAAARGGKYRDLESKSGAILTRVVGDHLIANKVKGKYWMYFNVPDILMATSDNLIDWTPLEDAGGKPLKVLSPRRGYFDSWLVEAGPPAVLTKRGIVLLYNAGNSADSGDARLPAKVYTGGQALFAVSDPTKLVARSDEPFIEPTEDYEKTGQYPEGTTFVEGLVPFKGCWFLYYGTADSRVGVAVWNPGAAP